MKFYPADWRSDPVLRLCSIAARGLWMELICLMHEADPYGHLLINRKVPSDTQIGALTGIDPNTVRTLLSELEEAGVFSRSRAGVIYSRRMVADEKRSLLGRKTGKLGGDIDLNALGTVDGGQRVKRFNRKDNPAKVKAVWEACGGCCSHCGVEMDFNHRNLPNSFEIDHIVPLSQGAGNELENLRGVCKRCNLLDAKKLGRERRLQSEGHPTPDPSPNPTANTKKLDTRTESKNPPKGPPAGGLNGAGRFSDFWEAYPSRGDATNPKKPAEEKFQRLVASGVNPAVIIAGAKAYAEHCRATDRDGTDKVLQAKTFLNQQVYADYSKPRAVPGSGKWRNRLVYFRDGGLWDGMWGAPPGQPGCQAPAELLAEILKEGAA
jgi:5-methylcytosine-specific restriction endonuclease McrA